MASSSSSVSRYKVGDSVLCHGKPAVIKFIGETHFGPGLWIGVQSTVKADGRNDGTVQGKRYFTCPMGLGLFVRESQVKPYDDKEKAAIAIQSAARGSIARQKARHDNAFAVWTQLDENEEQEALMKNREVARAVDSEIRMKLGLDDKKGGMQRYPSSKSLLLKGESITEDMISREAVPSDYTGPHISFPLKREQCIALIDHFRDHPDVLLHRKYVWQLLTRTEQHLEDHVPSALLRYSIPKDDKHKETRLLLCGDVHGQLTDVLWLFYKFGPPSATNIYLFNGDIADRGANAVEIFLLLFAFKLHCPGSVLINRGNHESADMNEVYGFAQEVRQKYGGLFYRKFQDIFHLLPLAMIIESRIICVHGGLFRKENVTLKQLESLNRQRPCPEAPNTYEDLLMFDLLWSDPQPEQGRKKSARGVDCMMFGPDVTDRFLTRNQLDVCIRSHQVPSTGRGFEVHHDGKCVTVFSASNYCGTSGNYGGVIVFQPDLSFEIQEYWAPSLLEIQQLARETLMVTSKVGALTSKLKEMERRASQRHFQVAAERMETDSIKKISKLVVEKKQDLWWYFWNADDNKKGKVAPQVWRDGCSAIVGDTLPWIFLQKQLKVVDDDGTVDYNAFLKRFKVEFVPPSGSKHARWKAETIQKVFEAILKADLSLRETLLLLDRNSDGTVCYQEFLEFMNALNLGLSEPQTRALMRTITASHTSSSSSPSAAPQGSSGSPSSSSSSPAAAAAQSPLLRHLNPRIHVAQFLARFKVVYEGCLKARVTEPWIPKALLSIGRLILTEASEKSPQPQPSGVNEPNAPQNRRRSSSFRAIFLLQKFHQSDTTGDGFLTYKEFIDAMKTLPLKNIRDLDVKLDDRNLHKLAEAVDITGNGKINYCEFINAFHVVDQSSCSNASEEIWSEICTAMFKHKGSIKRALRHFDPDLTGLVYPDDLRSALTTLNTVLARTEAPLTPDQVEEIVEMIDTDGDGLVDYEEFLESFVVADVGVALIDSDMKRLNVS